VKRALRIEGFPSFNLWTQDAPVRGRSQGERLDGADFYFGGGRLVVKGSEVSKRNGLLGPKTGGDAGNEKAMVSPMGSVRTKSSTDRPGRLW
jgi:hypothetical protein